MNGQALAEKSQHKQYQDSVISMSVSTKHPDYLKMLPRWEMMRDVLEEQVKDKREIYLPQTAGQKAVNLPEIYEAYLHKAEFPSFTSDSTRSMVGLVSRLESNTDLPKKLEELKDNATADGFGLTQLFARAVENSLGYGRQGLLVDVDHDGKPYIAVYDAFSIINWKSTNNNGRKDLTLVVLVENWLKETNDEFSHETETVYRVLDLDEKGKYRVRLYGSDEKLIEEKTDTLSGIDHIPFVFIGCTDTSPDVDPIPLWTMAKCSIKSYQLSADYYHDLHLTCHPQAWVSGLDTDENIEYSGSSMIWKIPTGGNCGYLEISGNGIEKNRQAILDQKSAALEAGARVIDIGVESGEARQARQNDQYATLHSVVKVAVDGINKALGFMIQVLGIKLDKVMFIVTIDFAAAGIDPTVLANLYNAVMAEKISASTYWDYLRTGKLPNHQYDKEKILIETTTDFDNEPADQ